MDQDWAHQTGDAGDAVFHRNEDEERARKSKGTTRPANGVSNVGALKHLFGSDTDVQAGFDANAALDRMSGKADAQRRQFRASVTRSADVDLDVGALDFYDENKANGTTDLARRMKLNEFNAEKDTSTGRANRGCCFALFGQDATHASLCDLAAAALSVSCVAAGAAAIAFVSVLLATSPDWQDHAMQGFQAAGSGVLILTGGCIATMLARRAYTVLAWMAVVATLAVEATALTLLGLDQWASSFSFVVLATHVALFGATLVLFVILAIITRTLAAGIDGDDDKEGGPSIIPSAFARDQIAYKKQRLAAARMLQRLERGRRARRIATRAAELRVWLALARERGATAALLNVCGLVYVAAFAYVSWVFGGRFPISLVETWAIACLVSVVLECMVLEPFVILCRCVWLDVWPLVVRKRRQRAARAERLAVLRGGAALAAVRPLAVGAPAPPKRTKSASGFMRIGI